MATLPHDLTDLTLAPVLLEVDAQLNSFRGLDLSEVRMRIALETNREPRDRAGREDALLETVLRFIDLHGWEATWDDRGVALRHGVHVVTLGLPAVLVEYLDRG